MYWNFAIFLIDGTFWMKKTSNNSIRGLLNDYVVVQMLLQHSAVEKGHSFEVNIQSNH